MTAGSVSTAMSTPHEPQNTSDILILAPQPFYQERGTSIAVRLLAEELADAGYAVDLLCFHEGEPYAYPGINLYRIPALPGIRGVKPGFSLKKILCDALMLAQGIRLVRQRRYRVLHAVEESVFLARLLRLFFRTPYIYDMDSLLSRQLIDKFPWMARASGLLQRFEKTAMQASQGVIAVCEDLKRQVEEDAPATPVQVLEDISLLDAAGTEEAVDDIRRDYQIQGCILMYVGNLEQYQGIDLLLKAFALFPPEERQEYGLVLIGGRDEDIARYRKQADSLAIDGQVHFLGPRPVKHLGGYLRQADILLSPRIQGNNTPMKLYSYLASGKALIATRLPTHTQVLDEDIALLCEPEPETWMKAMHTLAGDEELRRRLGRAAELRARQRHSREAYREKLRRFYLEVVGPPA